TIASIAAELHRRVEQPRARALAAQAIRDDEPAQVRALFAGLGAVDDDAALDRIALEGQPQPVAPGDVAFAELRKLARDLALEGDAEAGMGSVVVGVQRDHAPDAAREIALVDAHAHRERVRAKSLLHQLDAAVLRAAFLAAVVGDGLLLPEPRGRKALGVD